MTNPTPQTTDFTRDVVGRYICNGLDEALRSTDTGIRADARPFDTIIVGGGTFGTVIAQQLYAEDHQGQHRVLVLEGGPFVLTEHVQNLPMLGIGPPGATSIAELRAQNPEQQRQWSREVWGLPWHSSQPFPGLAYCIGGRSLFWGGWSPQLLPGEMPTRQMNGGMNNRWPENVVDELQALPSGDSYFHQAADQIGVTETNDFMFGALHEHLRKQLFDGIKAHQVTGAIPLAELPNPADIPERVPNRERDMWKLEAPLGVQSRTRAGFFPFNKFSSVPLLIKVARKAQQDSGGDDFKKRLMVVPNCHIRRLTTENGRVTAVQTNMGDVPVVPGCNVIIALGTIESTRLALASFGRQPNSAQIGRNLMAHLRSNLNIRIPRSAVKGLDANLRELQSSALFVKGRHRFSDGTDGYFHLQITASGLGNLGGESEAEIFKKIPDIDGFDTFRDADDTTVVVTIRGIGQMHALNSDSRVELDSEPDEYGVQRAFVRLADPRTPGLAQTNPACAKDLELWNAMDRTADDVALVFANGGAYELLAHGTVIPMAANQAPRQHLPFGDRRDKLGSTHHETGTLWMGDDPTSSVTTPNGRFHHVENAYALGPATFPTIGSPNPMLTGIALGRRMARYLIQGEPLYAPEPGFQALFNGRDANNWSMAGPGTCVVAEGCLECIPGSDIGLFWCTQPMPKDYLLRLEWMCTRADDNSGVFLRFPDPFSKNYMNPAYVGVQFGYEVQIDEQGFPDGSPIHRTGAIYAVATQALSQISARRPGQWNEFEIRVQGPQFSVTLNGTLVCQFTNNDPARGQSVQPNFIGVQTHTGRVLYRHIRMKAL